CSDDWEAVRVSASGAILGRWYLAGGATFGGAGPILGAGSSGGWTMVEANSNQEELRRLEPIVVGTSGIATTVNTGLVTGRLVLDGEGVVVLGGGKGERISTDLTVGPQFDFPGQDQVVVASDGSIWGAFVSGTAQ